MEAYEENEEFHLQCAVLSSRNEGSPPGDSPASSSTSSTRTFTAALRLRESMLSISSKRTDKSRRRVSLVSAGDDDYLDDDDDDDVSWKHFSCAFSAGWSPGGSLGQLTDSE